MLAIFIKYMYPSKKLKLSLLVIVSVVFIVMRDTSLVHAKNSDLAVEQGGGVAVLSGTPEVPTGLTATAGTPFTIVNLKWNPVSDASYYVVYRNTSNSFVGLTPIGRTLIATTTYRDVGNPSTTYYYKVAAVNARGEGYNSAMASAYVCASVSQEQLQDSVAKQKAIHSTPGDIPPPIQAPEVSYIFCPGLNLDTGGIRVINEGSGSNSGSIPAGTTGFGGLSSKIIFKNLPSDQVAVYPGQKLAFDYSWTNKLDKSTLRNPNKKFTIRRRLWDNTGKKFVERVGVYTVNPGKSQPFAVRELLSKTLPPGTYTMEVEVSHYIPYSDEEPIIADKNSFNFTVSSANITPPGAWINPPPRGY